MRMSRYQALMRINRHVGYRIRSERLKQGMTLQILGDHLGVSYQQMQKYEQGASQVTAARLIRLASLLSVSVRYFFDGIRSNTHPEANSSDVLYILLLTDHPVVEHAAYRCCGVDSEKYALLILHHLSDAIAFLRSNPLGLDFPVPDLVLMDLGMSERTAEQNIAMAMRDKSITSIPIVGFGDAKKSKEIQEIYRKPIAGFFETSLDTKEFEAKLKSVIDYWRDIAMLPALRMVRHHSFH